MYDVYGDIVVGSGDLKKIELLKAGKRKIYTRSSFKSDYRVFETQWVSPYVQKKFDSRYVHRENGFLFYGDIKQCYFSPRYATERKKLQDLLKNYDLKKGIIIGSGISPFTVYLSQVVKDLTEYEINERAIHYGRINLNLNNCNALTHNKAYNSECSDLVVSVIPTIKWDFHLQYNFKKVCVFYVLLSTSQITLFESLLKKTYNCTYEKFKVRPYSKQICIYRYLCVNSGINPRA